MIEFFIELDKNNLNNLETSKNVTKNDSTLLATKTPQDRLKILWIAWLVITKC